MKIEFGWKDVVAFGTTYLFVVPYLGVPFFREELKVFFGNVFEDVHEFAHGANTVEADRTMQVGRYL